MTKRKPAKTKRMKQYQGWAIQRLSNDDLLFPGVQLHEGIAKAISEAIPGTKVVPVIISLE